jgi:orotidine-5'-phosphate decarboxylase
MLAFADRLQESASRRQSAIVVGMDPNPALFPPEVAAAAGAGPEALAEAFERFSAGILEAVAEATIAVKFQSAFYERLGVAGAAALARSLARARELGYITILDAKRADIGSTAEAYADAQLGDLPGTPGPFTDAVTVNPYLGEDGILPFIRQAKPRGKGMFVLVKTSNPSGPQLQDLRCDGLPVYRHAAALVRKLGAELPAACGLTGVGAVVGATYPGVLKELREAMPETIFLLPGVGAQGGKVADLAPAFLPGGRGALITASRSIIYAHREQKGIAWKDAARNEARKLREEFRACKL